MREAKKRDKIVDKQEKKKERIKDSNYLRIKKNTAKRFQLLSKNNKLLQEEQIDLDGCIKQKNNRKGGWIKVKEKDIIVTSKRKKNLKMFELPNRKNKRKQRR